MKLISPLTRLLTGAVLCGATLVVLAQEAGNRPPQDGDGPPAGDGPGFGGPPGFGPGGPGGFGGFGGGPGGFGGGPMGGQKTKLVKKFDKDGDGRLNAEERKAARESLSQQGNERGRGPGMRRGGFGPPGFGGGGTTPKPGRKLTPADVKNYPNAPLYDGQVFRTFFLEFESADWEKELADFKNTDVEVPAKLTVDGQSYSDVGVHFRGMSSFMMVGEGSKRSLNLSMDFVHANQSLGGYRTLNLLNSHEDASLLHSVLFAQIARDYLPTPQANFVRVVINGECWGVYVNSEQVNKEFLKEAYGTTKGARWKVVGSPNGRGGLNYLGDDPAAYKSIYTIKTKDNAAAWTDLIKLCQVLDATPADKLEAALEPLLDVDSVLRFMALENVLVNNDGVWTRASDYNIYQDTRGRFHLIPHDDNETFSTGGGPGGPGGRGPGGMRGFGPGMAVAPAVLQQADKNQDGKLSRDEFTGLADAWYDKLDPDKTGKVTSEQFVEKFGELVPMGPPGGFGQRGGPGGGGGGGNDQGPGQGPGGRGGRGGFGPGRFMGPGLFTALDANKDGTLTRPELKETFGKWFTQWDTAKSGTLTDENLRTGLTEVLPRPGFGGPGGGGGFGGRGPGGPGFGGPGGGGVDLDPLVSARDTSKPILSKLLAVPSFKTRYLGYVRDIAEKWLDWNRLGPVAQKYHAMIAEEVKLDTRKLDSTEEFERSLDSDEASSLKSFATKRRAYLLNHAAIKALAK